MKKTIFLHIGTHKTGSTALQGFCAQNIGLLKHNDIDYLIGDTIWNGHHYLGWLFRGNTAAINQYCRFKDMGIINHLQLSISNSECNSFLLSSENLFLMENQDSAERFFDVFKSYRFKVIVYLREQCDFLESWYYELVINDHVCLTEEFDDFIKKPRYDLDYSKVLAKWERFIDKEDFFIFPYSDIKRTKTLYSSLLSCMGISHQNGFMIPTATNERVNYKQLTKVLEINRQSLDALRRKKLVSKLLHSRHYDPSPKISLMSDSLRSKIAESCYLSNKNLLDHYGVDIQANVDGD